MSGTARPFLRWAGGKTSALPVLAGMLPPDWRERRFVSAFVGGGALFFALRGRGGHRGPAIVADANPHLVRAYQILRDQPAALIVALSDIAPTQWGYDGAKAALTAPYCPKVTRAASFIALNRMGFNGVCRFNKKGEFNTPMEKKKEGCDLVRADLLLACHDALQGVEIYHQDFRETLSYAGDGDAVFNDSPYWVQDGAESSFVGYTAEGFGDEDHEALLQLSAGAVEAGAHVINTNANNEAWRTRYERAGFDTHELQMRRAVNSSAGGRGGVTELVFVGKPS